MHANKMLQKYSIRLLPHVVMGDKSMEQEDALRIYNRKKPHIVSRKQLVCVVLAFVIASFVRIHSCL